MTRNGAVQADAFVCALGVMDRRLREQLGTHVPVYPVTGFSATLPIVQPERAPRHAAIDESRSVAFAPMGDRLRVTGGAQFAGYARGWEPADVAPLYDTMKQLFPGAVDYTRARSARLPATDDTRDHAALRHRPLPEPLVQHRPGPHGIHPGGRRRAHHRRAWSADATPPIDLEGLRIRRH